MDRGTLRVYLGAAPGVGKTYAMLDEGHRRRQRGADVVIGLVETHGRANTIAQLRDLEIVATKNVEHRGTQLREMDLDAIMRRRPHVALVDELAHSNVPGARNEKRWQDIDELLAAGIDVITTVNIQHLESLNDVVAKITGVIQRETVPDAVVRRADQIELVDMSPEALRKRMAHGNIYPPERADAALANYFRPGNLGALRELALLWVADRVEETLDDYRQRHHITDTWETRERVVVALTGSPGSEPLIRRAARIAGRRHGELIGVHVAVGDGLRTNYPADLARQRDLVVELGGTYKEAIGDDVAAALVAFARAEGATQLVLGASSRSRVAETLRGSVIAKTIRQASGIDVHVIATTVAGKMPVVVPRLRAVGLGWRRQLAGWLVVVVALPLLTVVLTSLNTGRVGLATDLLLYLLVAVVAAAAGGVVPGLGAAIAGFLLANYYLVPPVHTFTIGQTTNMISLAVFVIVAVTTSGFVTLARRRAYDVARARAEAEALARASATLAGSADPLPALVDHLRTTFGLDGVAVLARDGDQWTTEASSGRGPLAPDDGNALMLDEDGASMLVFVGSNLTAEDRLLLRYHADQLTAALSARALQQDAARASVLQEADALRTALLQAVSHDLRAPLANIKATITSLLSTDVEWEPATRTEFLTTVDVETDRMNRLVGNLLDMSRLQAGALNLRVDPVALDDVVGTALANVSSLSAPIDVDVDIDTPLVDADAELLERAIANLVANADRWTPSGQHVRIESTADRGGGVHLRIIDHGPGIPLDRRHLVIQPFQRLGDHTSGVNVGLGLAVANGFVEAMGGTLELTDTPGGGLTVDITLPIHRDARNDAHSHTATTEQAVST